MVSVTPPSSSLFAPLQIDEALTLQNRVVLAPMTRGRSTNRIVNELNQLYYEQRAGAGLIITEATAVSEQGYGWFGAPALYTQEQADGWKPVVDRVHQHEGKIFAQLWHMGRQGHPSFNSKNDVVSASAVRLEAGHTRTADGAAVPYVTPRALETSEISDIVEDFRRSAALAKQAGFDGVEVHGANGYLIDQFLQSVTNQRTDQYGGSFENRSRFLLELVDALVTVYPASRVAVRLSPNGAFGGMGSEDNFELFVDVLERLRPYGLAYVAILDGVGFGYHDKGRLVTAADAKKVFQGRIMANNSYTLETAQAVVHDGAADLVAFGRPYISNPDLAERLRHNWPLNPEAPYDVYWNSAKGSEGYTDYAAFDPAAQVQAPA